MIFVFGTTRSRRVSPDEAELLQDCVRCSIRGCGGRVRVIEIQRRFHFCFIPLCPLDKKNLVACPRCNTSLSMDQHMANYSQAKKIPVAKARIVMVGQATPVDPNKEETLPIVKTMHEEENCIATSVTATANHETTKVDATEATIV